MRKNNGMGLLLCKEKWEKFRTIRPPKGKAALPVGLEYYNVDWLFLGLGWSWTGKMISSWGPCQEPRREEVPGY